MRHQRKMIKDRILTQAESRKHFTVSSKGGGGLCIIPDAETCNCGKSSEEHMRAIKESIWYVLGYTLGKIQSDSSFYYPTLTEVLRRHIAPGQAAMIKATRRAMSGEEATSGEVGTWLVEPLAVALGWIESGRDYEESTLQLLRGFTPTVEQIQKDNMPADILESTKRAMEAFTTGVKSGKYDHDPRLN